jgi:hypothetical protein
MTELKLNPAVTSLEEEGAFFVLDKAMRLKAKAIPSSTWASASQTLPRPLMLSRLA